MPSLRPLASPTPPTPLPFPSPACLPAAHALGVARPTRTTLSIILSPMGPYFPSGLKPIALFVDEHHRRAWPGGVGDCKVGGNYAPTIRPQVEAAQRYGTPQVVYTFKQADQVGLWLAR